jgi:Protein of unknown function (DUF4035)
MTVAELEERMTVAEFREWQAFAAIEGPFGGERGDIQAAMMTTVLANIYRRQGTRPYTPKDFMPFAEKTSRRAQTPEEINAIFAALAAKDRHG